jgi:peptidoglycan/LPS O-acetylase OafA/YrhL
MKGAFFERFRRVTDSTTYLPQVDGLRFLAIFSVAVVMHITNYLDREVFDRQLIPDGYWKNFVMEGGTGVALFFAISGFILSLPFARWRLNGERPVVLRRYYLRRLIRLEPPYLIALLLLFFAHVFLLHNYSFGELLPHLLVSAVYLHTLVYKAFSLVMPVAWSLEVEVQFYILAPLFFLLFRLPSSVLRRSVLAVVIAGNWLYWLYDWDHAHVFKFLHYFFAGMLVADLYVCGVRLPHRAGWFLGGAALLAFVFVPSIDLLWGSGVKMLAIFLLLFTVLTHEGVGKLFALRPLALIGGMCYSIYLLHFAIISALGMGLQKLGWVPAGQTNVFWLIPLFALVVLLVSALFFLFVEKPFMRLRPRR